MWTPPFGKGFYVRLCNTVRCSHMSGLRCAAPMAAGPDDIRGLNSIHGGELDALTKPRACSIPGLDRFASPHNHPSQAK